MTLWQYFVDDEGLKELLGITTRYNLPIEITVYRHGWEYAPTRRTHCVVRGYALSIYWCPTSTALRCALISSTLIDRNNLVSPKGPSLCKPVVSKLIVPEFGVLGSHFVGILCPFKHSIDGPRSYINTELLAYPLNTLIQVRCVVL